MVLIWETGSKTGILLSEIVVCNSFGTLGSRYCSETIMQILRKADKKRNYIELQKPSDP